MTPVDKINTEAIRHYYRGRVFEATGELEIAIEEYKKAIEYGADYADVHNSLGRVLAKKGFFEEARIEFETALRLNPRYFEAQRNLNELMVKMSLLSQQKSMESTTATTSILQPKKEIVTTVEASEQIEKERKFYELLYKKKIVRLVLTYSVVGVIVLILLVTGYKKICSARIPVQKVYDVKMETISSISKLNDKIVLSCWASQEINIFRIYKNNIMIVSSFKFAKENIVPNHICILENNLYILDAWSKKIYKCLIANNRPVVTKVIDISQTEPLGLVGYQNYVLLFDNKNRIILVYNKDLNKIVDTVPYIVKDITAVSSFGSKIWLLDNNYMIYQLKGYREIINSYKLDFAVGKQISSFLIDNKYLWFVEEGSPYLYCYSKNIFQ